MEWLIVIIFLNPKRNYYESSQKLGRWNQEIIKYKYVYTV